jgi:hypothetical protein
MNFYAYAGNDPINGADPYGLTQTKACKNVQKVRCYPPVSTRGNWFTSQSSFKPIDNSDGLGWARYLGFLLTPFEKYATPVATFEVQALVLGLGAMGEVAMLPAVKVIATPYGEAAQGAGVAAQVLRSEVSAGAEIYRGGMFGRSAAGEAQFWAAESPLNPGFANRVGAATLGSGTPDFVLGGTLRSGAQFITRLAPGLGNNLGGALEIVTDPFAIRLTFFHMP